MGCPPPCERQSNLALASGRTHEYSLRLGRFPSRCESTLAAPSCALRRPAMSKVLPGPEDLRALPPRGVIAFGARCCRRIQPLYELPSAQPHPATLEDPIRAAEAFARGDGPTTAVEASRLAVALSHAANAARAAGHAWACLEPWQHRHRDEPGAGAAHAYAETEANEN